MSDFSENQLKELTKKLDRSRVQQREAEGRVLDYLEGWFAISEANAIFGYGGWDREMVFSERVIQARVNSQMQCAYIARVRIRVRTSKTVVIREGTGFGQASSPDPGEAHEQAIKAAETDATKRALSTFGNRFGLSLYDPDRTGVTKAAVRRAPGERRGKPSGNGSRDYQLIDPDGKLLADNLSAEGFCTGLRQLIEACSAEAGLAILKSRNAPFIERLRQLEPNLKTGRGEHYADILERLLDRRLEKQPAGENAPTKAATEGNGAANPETPPEQEVPLPESRIGPGKAIDKSELPIGTTTRRVRSKAHLNFVASKPCLVCEQLPCHAHHLTFAQPRGLSVKVSDEFTVPLCAVHHNELHGWSNERAWWRKHRIDPLTAAKALWEGTKAKFDRAEIKAAPTSPS